MLLRNDVILLTVLDPAMITISRFKISETRFPCPLILYHAISSPQTAQIPTARRRHRCTCWKS